MKRKRIKWISEPKPSATPYTDKIAAEPGYGRGDLLMFMRNMEIRISQVEGELELLAESVRLTAQAKATAAKRREARGMKLRTRKGA